MNTDAQSSDVHDLLQQLHSMSSEIIMSVVITKDGLHVAHLGNVGDPDHFAAYLLELQMVSQKILTEFELDQVEEIYVRSTTGCVSMMPIFEKGYLACLSTPKLGSAKLMLFTCKYIQRLYDCI